jgi:hypothetical protein
MYRALTPRRLDKELSGLLLSPSPTALAHFEAKKSIYYASIAITNQTMRSEETLSQGC